MMYVSFLIRAEAYFLLQKDGWTALHVSVYYGQRDIVKKLLEEGANVNKRTKSVR